MGGSGGNFDNALFVDQGGKIIPGGPLNPGPNSMEEVYSWVIQVRKDGSAAHISEQSLAGLDAGVTRWTTQGSDKVSQHGEFEDGPAFALAIGIAKTPEGKLDLSWWSEIVSLKRIGQPSST